MLNQEEKILVDFLFGEKPNLDGLYLMDILNWSDFWLEYNHSYIQWIFPLLEKSIYNPDAPILTKNILNYLQNHPSKKKIIQHNIGRCFRRMLEFYGFCLNEQDTTILKKENHRKRLKKWCNQKNHNFLRVTRILKSLQLFELDIYAELFFQELKMIYATKYREISDSFDFWEKAMQK